MSALVDQLDPAGFVVVQSVLPEDTLTALERDLPASVGEVGGVRNLLDMPRIATVAASASVRALVEPVLGQGAFAVRAILFDKTPVANWRVSWHQDLTIAVKERTEIAGYGPWSEKAGVVHVQPPVGILEHMLAVRLHIDESGETNGPLKVLPGSHRAGKLRDEDIPNWRERVAEQVCLVPRGGALVMRPLLLHASSPAATPDHRRVLHIEYASCALASGLEWRWGEPRARAA
jgi:ectoine hydroxylase-related dioxygenase (phytanoyl-CoA dioxygenase family)